MAELEDFADLPGFGPSKIESFRDAGYTSPEDLRGITWEELGEIRGIKSPAKRRAVLTFLEAEGLRTKPEREENYERFRTLLEELFQFESADLDFGIYRIINRRRDEIETFLETELRERVRRELAEIRAVERSDAEARLAAANAAIENDFPQWLDENGTVDEERLPDDPSGIVKERKGAYLEAKTAVESARIGERTEAAIYQDLYRFFSRYYENGDFVPQRRASRQEKYAIPYNGEEVALHWANKDQYFVKTDERFKDYSFRTNSYDVTFELHDAHVEKNDTIGERKYFVLHGENPIEQDGYHLRVDFAYRPLTGSDCREYDVASNSQTKARDVQRRIERRILAGVSAQLEAALTQPVDDSRSDSTVLEKHLRNYRTKNESDYFIHRDLGAFLRRELDWYVKNELFTWREMTDGSGEIPPNVGARLTAVENIATEIIELVDGIEAFQKKLYEKQKFVVDTEHCLSVDRISEELYPEIVGNEAQVAEWESNYGLDADEIDASTLDGQGSLMVDTRFFSGDLARELTPSGEPDNLLFKSENAAALRLLAERYAESIDCVYIDPPYNASASQVPFKDAYEESSWMSMMDERLRLVRDLLAADGIIYVSIDDSEVAVLRRLMDAVFGEDNFLAQLIWDLGTGTSAGHFTRSHEYVLAYAKDKDARENFEYVGEDDIIRERAVKRISEKNPATEITFPPGVPYEGEDATLTEEIGGSEKIRIKDDEMRFEDGALAHEVTLEAGWAMKDQIESWLNGEETRDTKGQKLKRFVFRADGRLDYEKVRSKINPKTVIDDVGSTRRGTAELGHKFEEFPTIYPKPTDLIEKLVGWAVGGKEEPVVLDFFAGSGTTGEAALNLREEGIDLTYILVEQGAHFHTLLKPRLLKAVYSREWKETSPLGVSDRSHSFQYHVLEQYEDALNNLDAGDEQSRWDDFNRNALEYFLDFEVDGPSLLDLEEMRSPLEYELEIRDGDDSRWTRVDLVETFNYLLGLAVETDRRYEFRGRTYRVITGTVDGEAVAIVWRRVDGDESARFYEDERAFLASEVLDDDATVYINADSALPDAKSTERAFQKRMW